MEYNAGKRVSQMPPFRFYLFISVLFFSLGFLSGKPVIRMAPAEGGAVQPVGSGAAKRKPVGEATGSQVATGPERGPTLGSLVRSKLDQLPEQQRETAQELSYAFPKILIFCLPLFALGTRFLFRSEQHTYLEHLVIAVHFHTFIFLWKMVGDGWAHLLGLFSDRLGSIASAVVALWFMLYPLLMFRRLFGRPWLHTTVKSLILFVAYMATIVGCFIATAGLLLFLH